MRYLIGGAFLMFGLALVAWAIYEIESPWLTLGVGVVFSIVGLGVAGPDKSKREEREDGTDHRDDRPS